MQPSGAVAYLHQRLHPARAAAGRALALLLLLAAGACYCWGAQARGSLRAPLQLLLAEQQAGGGAFWQQLAGRVRLTGKRLARLCGTVCC